MKEEQGQGWDIKKMPEHKLSFCRSVTAGAAGLLRLCSGRNLS